MKKEEMVLREVLEEREYQFLSPYASKSKESQGRKHPLAPCPLRTDFQRDRDRIIHSKGFRRLKYKTQVFLPDRGDHFRTRLTHTLEVSQVARTLARGLFLNEDLVEAIALGHDLGHTPFGHAGERALDALLQPGDGFHHHEQSLRLVDSLEKEGFGLNLTYEVRDGILNHTSKGQPKTLEGQVVSYADRIAYINHDIDDALRSGILSFDDLPHEFDDILGNTHSSRINGMVLDLINTSSGQDVIAMSSRGKAALDTMRAFLFSHLYTLFDVQQEEKKGEKIIRVLFHHYQKNPEEIPDSFQDPDLSIRIKDYIAGMTDSYAIQCFEDLFIPKGFHR